MRQPACICCGTEVGLDITRVCSRCGNAYCIKHWLPHMHECRYFNINRFGGPNAYGNGMRDVVASSVSVKKKKAKKGGLAAWLTKMIMAQPEKKGPSKKGSAKKQPAKKRAPKRRKKK